MSKSKRDQENEIEIETLNRILHNLWGMHSTFDEDADQQLNPNQWIYIKGKRDCVYEVIKGIEERRNELEGES